jgi:DNA-binding CsgD family transcriptional regulator
MPIKGEIMSNQRRKAEGQKKHAITFTLRESQCIEQVAQNKSLADMCSNLNVSKATVYFYINAIKEKLERLRREIIESRMG